MIRCIYCGIGLSEKEEHLYGDKCTDHALQFDDSTEVTGARLLHDQLPDDYDEELDELDPSEELNFND